MSLMYLIFISLILILIFVVFLLNAQKKKYSERIYALAFIDALTGLWNINRFREEAGRFLAHNKEKSARKFAVISFDISKFKCINENFGRNMGDKVIQKLADVLLCYSTEEILTARVSKDHFIIGMMIAQLEEIGDLLYKIQEDVSAFTQKRLGIFVCFNSGVYVVTSRGCNFDSAFDQAELARKEAKKFNEKAPVFFNDEMAKKSRQTQQIEKTMKKSMQNGEFLVYMQPKYDLISNRLFGAEALIRWNSSAVGFLPPDAFISLFEKNGFIVEMDFFVLERVCEKIQRAQLLHFPLFPISVNQSRVTLSQPNYLERLFGIFEKYQTPLECIELEITETIFVGECESIIQIIKELKAHGIKISMDDFGTGYSSLNLLNKLPIDVLKLDRVFLQQDNQNGRSEKIISCVIHMAKELQMQVVCEGVETEAQMLLLKKLGCNFGQGYYFAKPMPMDEFGILAQKSNDLA